MNASLTAMVKHPKDCSRAERQEFIEMVLSGGEVAAATLEGRVCGARLLAFVFEEGNLLGIGALKNPLSSYRAKRAAQAGIPLNVAALRFELGYVFVSPNSRGRKISNLLVAGLLSHLPSAGVWATSRTDNHAMHRTLVNHAFAPYGEPFASDRGEHRLQFFLRSAVDVSIVADAMNVAQG